MESFIIQNNNKQAKVFVSKEFVDSDTIKQIESVLEHESVDNVKIMPDCHKSNGCCNGLTYHLQDKIMSNIIGNDIGCGISAYPLPLSILTQKKALEKIDTIIKSNIPIGGSVKHGTHGDSIIEIEQLESFFEDTRNDAIEFSKKYKEKFNIDISKYIPNYSSEWFINDLCERINLNPEYAMCSIGTLGNGNHFIEIDKCDNELLLVVHTGSRCVGNYISYYYNNLKSKDEDIDDYLNDDEDIEFENETELSNENAYKYYFDMLWAQKFAKINRIAIISSIVRKLGVEFISKNIIESVHNYIDFNDLIVRKGSISAKENELCIIALNMRDGILIGNGLNNIDWNYSAPHGAGRIISRKNKSKGYKKDKKDIEVIVNKFAKELDNVYSTCISYDTYDERPSAYKNSEMIIEAIKETVEITKHYKTILNIKGS